MDTQTTSLALQDIEALRTRSELPVLVHCAVAGSPASTSLGRVLDELAPDMRNALAIETVDIAANPDVSTRYGVVKTTGLLLFYGGRLQDVWVGIPARVQVRHWLASHDLSALIQAT